MVIYVFYHCQHYYEYYSILMIKIIFIIIVITISNSMIWESFTKELWSKQKSSFEGPGGNGDVKSLKSPSPI